MNPDCGSVNTYSSINLHQDRVRPELNQLMIGGRTLSHLSLLYCSKPNIVSLQVIHFCPLAVSSSLRILLSSVFPEAPSVDSNNAILDSDNWVCHLQTACQPELTTASGQSRRDGSDTGEEYKKTLRHRGWRRHLLWLLQPTGGMSHTHLIQHYTLFRLCTAVTDTVLSDRW